MKLPKNINLKTKPLLYSIGLVLGGILIISILLTLTKGPHYSVSKQMKRSGISSMGRVQMDSMMDYGYGGGYEESAKSLSIRNIVPSPIPPHHDGNIPGDDAEDFEVTQYHSTIESRDIDHTCRIVFDLKAKDYVIFENSNKYDKGCNYSFKVKNAHSDEILTLIKDLDPKELTKSSYTIKKIVNDYTNEVEILEKRKASIDETLNYAIGAYDKISEIATKENDVESLTKIIEGKIRIVERLTQERININNQLERLERSKNNQLDRLDYVYFYVNVYESKFVDFKSIKDSWKASIKTFVRDTNQVIQDISINLITLIFLLAQYIVYFLLILLAGKYTWKWSKQIWKKK